MYKILIAALMMACTTCMTAQNIEKGDESYTDELDVVVNNTYKYFTNGKVTYSIHVYEENDTTKLDVKIPAYQLEATVIGTLSIGTYTVKGLIYDKEKGGYYRDYKDDGLTMDFSNGGTISGSYKFSIGNILVTLKDDKVTSILNTFTPGAMPFPIVSTFPGVFATAINDIKSESINASSIIYNIKGQQVAPDTHGIIIVNGKKYLK